VVVVESPYAGAGDVVVEGYVDVVVGEYSPAVVVVVGRTYVIDVVLVVPR